MFIAPFIYNMILGKLWMNKYGVLLDMMKDKILFVLDRCNHDGNEILIAEDLAILPDLKPKPPTL